MEKFSKFRDEATGIAPFLSVKSTQTVSLGSKLALYPLALLSVPVILLYLLGYALVFQFLPGASTWCLKLVLRLLRLLYLNFSYEGEKRVSVRRCQQLRARPGDVIVSNFVSPLDAFIFASVQRTVFIFPTPDGQFASAGLFEAAAQALSATPYAEKGHDIGSIVKIAKTQGAVAVLFVEGTTSNGRGLLTLKDLGAAQIRQATPAFNIFPAALRYTPATVTTPIPQTLLGYLWHLLTNSWWYMCSARLGNEPLRSETVSHESIARAICSVGRLRQLGDRLDAKAKQDFIKAYNEKR